MNYEYFFNYYLDGDVNWQPSVYVVLEMYVDFIGQPAVAVITANPGRPHWFEITKSFNHERMRNAEFSADYIITESEAKALVARLGLELEDGKRAAFDNLRARIGKDPYIVDRVREISREIENSHRRFINELSLGDL